MQTRATRPAAEDIDAVLNRFQAWNSARETKESGAGVREMSYDEALASSRGPAKRDSPASYAGARAENAGRQASAGQPPATQRPAGQHLAAQHQAAQHPSGQYPNARPSAAAVPTVATEKKTSEKKGAEKKAAEKKQAGRASTSRRKAVAPAKVRAGEARPQAAAKKARPSRQPEFRAALASSVGAALPGHAGANRQVSMSLRVAPSERALIMIRAAEAGISVSAYLRQCALDVEILRAQVRQFMAVSARDRLVEFQQASGMASGVGPATAAPTVKSEGWFSRWQQRIWGSIGGSRPTQLSLKA
jgi:hypothetical protein